MISQVQLRRSCDPQPRRSLSSLLRQESDFQATVFLGLFSSCGCRLPIIPQAEEHSCRLSIRRMLFE